MKICNGLPYKSRTRSKLDQTLLGAAKSGHQTMMWADGWSSPGPLTCPQVLPDRPQSGSYDSVTSAAILDSWDNTIVDEVLSTSDKILLRKEGIPYPKRCFKNITSTKNEFHVLGTPEMVWVHSEHFYDSGGSGYRRCNAYGNTGLAPLAITAFWSPLTYWENTFPSNCITHVVSNVEIDQALARLRPRIDSLLDNVSIPNFLLELRELKTLGKLFSTKYANIASASGDKFLGINFGLLPLVRDINTIKNLERSIDKFVDMWNGLASKGEIITYHTTMFNFVTEFTEIVPISGYYHTLNKTCTSSAKMAIYVLPKQLPSNIKRKLKSRLSGFDSLSEVIWEAIPFSFVVDWFTNIGDLFDADLEDLLVYDIVDGGYSLFNETRVTCTTRKDFFGIFEADLFPTEQFTSTYTRVKLHPDRFSAFALKGKNWNLTTSFVSPHQAALAAALTYK